MTSSKKPFGLYIHVPFCSSKCPYCDFYSERKKDNIPLYLNAVKEELAFLNRSKSFVSPEIYNREVSSVYFGGGTPSVLRASDIKGILGTVKEKFILSKNAEVTLECNPSLKNKEEFFEGLKNAGVNRVSLGLQSAVLSERKALGRLGSAEDAAQAVYAAKKAGIEDISLDIMLGIPEQTQDSLKFSLDFALNLPVSHLSVYILKLEEGTVFFSRKDKLDLPDDDAVSDMYLFTCEHLKKKGMRHYEISNFCFDNFAGKHNLNYWKCGEYLGIGPSAHSFINGKRFYFERDISAFICGAPPIFDCDGGSSEERLMLALRTDEGISIPEKSERLSEIIKEFQNFGLLNVSNDRVILTDKGFLVSNYIISEILSEI
ncbi:MAG: radical SAM family heme chaperone HemW [Oscillospiraceae bacterium]|nr:radical SAM family heme chaperone HemW [Oscillospiraceae bacterium]